METICKGSIYSIYIIIYSKHVKTTELLTDHQSKKKIALDQTIASTRLRVQVSPFSQHRLPQLPGLFFHGFSFSRSDGQTLRWDILIQPLHSIHHQIFRHHPLQKGPSVRIPPGPDWISRLFNSTYRTWQWNTILECLKIGATPQISNDEAMDFGVSYWQSHIF